MALAESGQRSIYGTTHGEAYGYNERAGRTFDQASTQKLYVNPSIDARRTMIGNRPNTNPSVAQQGNMAQAMSRTMGNACSASGNYNFSRTAQDPYQFQTRSAQRFPTGVGAPQKDEFYPAGTRVSYAKGRKTFPNSLRIAPQVADRLPQPQKDPPINFTACGTFSAPSMTSGGRSSTEAANMSDSEYRSSVYLNGKPSDMTTTQYDASVNYGKQSVSRRLPQQHELRYHVPGYMGFVRDMQYHHGRSYGKITRECIMKEHL